VATFARSAAAATGRCLPRHTLVRVVSSLGGGGGGLAVVPQGSHDASFGGPCVALFIFSSLQSPMIVVVIVIEVMVVEVGQTPLLHLMRQGFYHVRGISKVIRQDHGASTHSVGIIPSLQ
jgi:hypothetical protein